MSPEQALGGIVDARSDLYSLGAMLYELLTGRPPFLGDDPIAVVTQHLETPPVAPTWHDPGLPRALESLVLRLLAKAPVERPESAAAVLESLSAIADVARGGAVPPAEPAAVGNPLDRLASGVYVGREQDLGRLRAVLEDTLSGRGRVVLLTGEPGIGKTRIAEELATYAQLRGCEVLWGRCQEGEGAPPYWPWTQVIRSYARGRDSESLVAELGAEAAEIVHVVPELRPYLAAPSLAAAADSEQARFRLFDSVSRFLQRTADRRPLVLVLDDVHWADEASLLLLRFLAGELNHGRILVVAAYSDLELGRHHPLARTVAKLTTSYDAERIVLRGLSEAGVGRFIELAASVAPAPELVSTVHRETEGNPFFVAEVVRLLAADGRLDDAGDASSWEMTIPESVRQAIGLRLDRLSGSCNKVLAIASAVGREFDLAVLERVSDLGDAELTAALEEAIAARVVVDAPQAHGRYRFSHALIRQTLYQELASPRRTRLHGRIGEVLEELHGATVDAHVNELAHHFVEAGQLGKGIEYAVRAARQATGRLAYEEAVTRYRRALQALDVAEPVGDAHRCDLLLELGEAHAHAGNPAGARDAFERAAELARSLADPERLARAALGYGGPSATFGVMDESLITLLEEAHAGLGEAASPLRAMVLARMAAELYFSSATERRAELARDAVQMARRLEDPAALAYALNAGHGALWGPENAQERLAIATEIIALAERAGSRALALQGHARRVTDLLELGDVAAADAEIAVHAALALELREPADLWRAAVWRATRAHLDGRFDEAGRLAGEALAVGRRLFESEATQCHTVQMFFCAIEQGAGAELEDLFRRFGEEVRAVPGWHAATAQLYSELGRKADARRELDSLAANGFQDLPRDNTWLPAIACAAEACAFLGDPRVAEVLHGLLLPYASRNIVAVEGWICLGSAERLLGLLAATMRRFQESEARFEAALALNARMGARPWLARTRYQYARALLERGEPGDTERARVLIDTAIEDARELGMQRVLERALELADLRPQEVDDHVGGRSGGEDLRDARLP
jgi:tetratricopeptide (TPR) repeat protein